MLCGLRVVVGCLLIANGCELGLMRRELRAACWLLVVVWRCMLSVVWCVLFGVMPDVTWRVLAVWCQLFVGDC